MADIELVIKIPEEMYKWIYDVNNFSNDYGMGDFIDLIKNGTLLDKIKERISLEKLGYEPSAGYYIAIDKVLQIIDKYRNEVSE